MSNNDFFLWDTNDKKDQLSTSDKKEDKSISKQEKVVGCIVVVFIIVFGVAWIHDAYYPANTKIETTNKATDIAQVGDWEFKIINIKKSNYSKKEGKDYYIITLMIHNLNEKTRAPDQSNPMLIDDKDNEYEEGNTYMTEGKSIWDSVQTGGISMVRIPIYVKSNVTIKAFKISDTPGDNGGAVFAPVKKKEGEPAIFDLSNYNYNT